MKYLHSWLQEYIEEKIPQGEDLREVISINAFEVEEVIEIENKLDGGKDFIYEINVLPNRNHDALSHYFMAKEIALIYNLKFKKLDFNSEEYKKDFVIKKTSEDYINISDYKACTRFMGAKVKNISVRPSPLFIKYRLESIGQKSINNIVDITNYVQFSFNKPMHAYDESKISDFLEARFATEGEIITTLDNKELNLDDKTLVIVDAEKVLGLAGIKGGNSSGISTDTKNIIVESANFNSTLIRKTSQKYNLKTDASKRFENAIADSLVEIGMIETLKLIKEYASDEDTEIEITDVIDNWPKDRLNSWNYQISVSLNELNNLIGVNLSVEEVEKILSRFDFKFKYISTKDNIKDLMKNVLDKPYKNPSSMREDAPEAFSCSSLVSYLYEGVYMPSISIDKYLYTRDLGKNIKSKGDLRFGDFIFINTGEVKATGIYFEGKEYKKGEKVEEGIDHLAMCVGEGNVLHSSSQLENGTEIETLERFLERGRFVGYGRVLENLEEERFVITIPPERLDLRIKEDLIEEVARVYGLNNIKSVLPELNRVGIPNKRLYYENKIRNILFKFGFSEVYNYSLRNKGDIEILKSVAQDKNFLRNNLSEGVQEAIQKNIFNMPLIDMDEVKIFEFGNCFSVSEIGVEKEWKNLCIAIDDGKKNKNYKESIQNILEEIKKEINCGEIKFVESNNERQKENCIEINFDELINHLSEGEVYIDIDKNIIDENIKYKPFSLTPFIVRDIACWTSENTNQEDIENTIRENISSLCISVKLFDKFEKEIDGVKKKSFGFRLIYQDESRTLTDEEVNQEAERVYNALKAQDFEIR